MRFSKKFIDELTTAVIKETARREWQNRLDLEHSIMLARWEEVRKYREGLPPFDKEKRDGVKSNG